LTYPRFKGRILFMNEQEKAILNKLEKLQTHFEVSNLKYEKLEKQITQLQGELSSLKNTLSKTEETL
jgi:peptidoglycan hydrolase CwlO-like protein